MTRPLAILFGLLLAGCTTPQPQVQPTTIAARSLIAPQGVPWRVVWTTQWVNFGEVTKLESASTITGPWTEVARFGVYWFEAMQTNRFVETVTGPTHFWKVTTFDDVGFKQRQRQAIETASGTNINWPIL